MDEVKEFLKELTELSKKYGIFIGGCGCCGSPFLYADEGGINYKDLDFQEKENRYTVYDCGESKTI